MALVTRRDSTGNRMARDPFALARDLFALDLFDNNGRAPNAFMPRFEVKERGETFEIHADVPGVKEEDLDVSLHDGVLSISGHRSAEPKQDGESYFVYERQFGTFSRSFSLPDIADAEKVNAKLSNGVLTVTIGKRPEAKPRKIALKRE